MEVDLGSVGSAAVGGLAAFGGVLYTQRRAAKKDRQERAATAITAALILQEDLAWARDRAKLAKDNGRYWSGRYGLQRDSWIRYRATVAAALVGENGRLDKDAWTKLRDGFHSVRTLELQASKRRQDELSRPRVDDWGMRKLDPAISSIDAALAALDAIAAYQPRESLEEDPADLEPESPQPRAD